MMGPRREPRLPLGPPLPNPSASLLASLSVTRAEGPSSLEISFLCGCVLPPGVPEETSRGGLCPSEGVRATCHVDGRPTPLRWAEGRNKGSPFSSPTAH